jgi:hypothetical protein
MTALEIADMLDLFGQKVAALAVGIIGLGQNNEADARSGLEHFAWELHESIGNLSERLDPKRFEKDALNEVAA